MDAITVTAVVGTLLSVVNIVDSIWASIDNARLTKQANKIAAGIARNKEFQSKLLTAYNNKDMKLAQDLLNSSPWGSSFRALTNEAARLKKDFEQKESQSESLDRELNEQLNQVTAAQSGSKIASAIAGVSTPSTKQTDSTLSQLDQLTQAGADLKPKTNSKGINDVQQ